VAVVLRIANVTRLVVMLVQTLVAAAAADPIITQIIMVVMVAQVSL
jgi:hypothetical protein